MDGHGRVDRHAFTTSGYIAPRGYYTQLTRNGDGTFLERDRHIFSALHFPKNDHNKQQTKLTYENEKNTDCHGRRGAARTGELKTSQ
jgi:hypothetical protein